MSSLLLTRMSLAEAIYSRHSVRSFTDMPVETALIDEVLRAAVRAPTAMHAEPWMFVVIQDKHLLRRYSDLAKTTLIAQAELYRDLHDPSVTPKNGGFLKALGSPSFNVFYDAGTAVLICTRETNAFGIADCWLAAENLMLAATALQLGACCVGSALPGLNLPEVKQELSIPVDADVIAAIALGKPVAASVPNSRKPPHILVWRTESGSRNRTE